MKYKAGDTARIQSKEWIDAQKKDGDGDIGLPNSLSFVTRMFQYAGQIATIAKVIGGNRYELDVDDGRWCWADWMFDPDYNTGPLYSADAVIMMAQGETLYNAEGFECIFKEDKFAIFDGDGTRMCRLDIFTGLYRRPPKRRRPMTPEEARAWAESDESLGWMIKLGIREWTFPRFHGYGDDISHYRRARMLPDMSGVDEGTIQGFEVEE